MQNVAVLGAPREMLTTIGPSNNSMEFCKAALKYALYCEAMYLIPVHILHNLISGHVFIVLLAAATILLPNITGRK